MSDKIAGWNSICNDLDRLISSVEGMLLSPQFDDKQSLEVALNDLVNAKAMFIHALIDDNVSH